jgi:glycosyltransferase involved in cell wall biosynthesis
MRIGIDARFYNLHGGLGRYVSELLHHLTTLPTDHQWYFFVPVGTTIDSLPANCQLIETDIPWYGWREQVQLPRLLNKYRLDLMHFPHFNIPLLYNRPFVVTIHDLILLTQPDSAKATTLGPLRYQFKRCAYQLTLRRAVSKARAVIATSEHTKRDILKFFPRTKNIAITYQASRWPVIRSTIERRHQFLYVGNCYPHKNVDLLIRAFVIFGKSRPEYSLVIGSHADAFFTSLKESTAREYPQAAIIFLPDPSDEQVQELYQSSELYVFPSRYEGFGLPGLEAMAAGLPVVSSDCSCLPEIYGRAACYFQSDSQADLLRIFSELTVSSEQRAKLQTAGYEQVQLYSWQQLAVDTLAIYEKALS